MNKGNKSKVLSIEIGKEHIEKFSEIHNFYNEQANYIYLPKYIVLQQMIDEVHAKLFDK
jgi:hypothetical protein